MSKSPELFDAFVENERYRFTDTDGNLLGLSVYQIMRYHEFLTIILERHAVTTKTYLSLHRANMTDFSEGSREVARDEMLGLGELFKYMTLVQLEVESFYLFAKILLDRTAHFVELFFGRVRKLSLDSHDKLTKNIESYAFRKGLTIHPSLLELMRRMRVDVSDHRDYGIAHEKSPRTVRTIWLSSDGPLSILYNRVLPTNSDKYLATRPLSELFDDLDKYLAEIVAFAQLNGRKTTLTLKTTSEINTVTSTNQNRD